MNLQQFNKEVVEFRKIMCNPQFWDKAQPRHPLPVLEKAANTLYTCYVNMNGSTEEVARAVVTLEATINEFHDRQNFLQFGFACEQVPAQHVWQVISFE